jgi:hypothetical protein
MFQETGTRILSAAGVEFHHLHFPHNERSLVLRSRQGNYDECERVFELAKQRQEYSTIA